MTRGFVWIRNGALILVIVAFVFFFGQPMGESVGGAVAVVDGEPIPREVFEFFRELQAASLGSLEESGIPAKQLQQILDEQTRASLVQRWVLAREAARLGLRVTDDEVRREIHGNPQFQNGGIYDPEIVRRIAARGGLTVRQYLDEYERDLLLRKLERLLVSPVRISDSRARREVLRNQARIRLRYVGAHTSDFLDAAQITDETAQRLLDAQPDRVRAAYESRKDEFQRPEQVEAAHILFEGPEGLARAEAARLRLDAGEDFAALARELSDDLATKDGGGSLGRFARGQMVGAIDEAAFGLEPGGISAPITTERGIHLVRLLTRHPAVDVSFETVALDLARELAREDSAREAARNRVAAVLDRLRAGEELDAAAKAEGLETRTSPRFRAVDPGVPGLRGVEGLLETAFSLTREEPTAGRIFTDGEAFYVASLADREEPSEASIAAEIESTRERLEQQERQLTMALWYRGRYKALEESGDLELYPLSPSR
jgi:peptidyl-prolyl cis-trans isomerase D